MADPVCALAADTKVETPEGPLTIRSLAGKTVAVFTRDSNGRVRFRLMQDIRKTAEQHPVLKITLENDRSFRTAPHQILFQKGMLARAAQALRIGDTLEPAFHYPAGYRFRDDVHGDERQSTASLRVSGIEPDGTADLYTFGVDKTGCFFVTAGVLCKAENWLP
jgi:hypothetical protein